MMFTRIRSYAPDGKFTGCEHIYARGLREAIAWFREDYPAHKHCTVVAEEYDPDECPEHFKACSECGCVHYWK